MDISAVVLKSRPLDEVLDACSLETADATRLGLEMDIVTKAPCSRHASATAKPMPLEPPIIRMRAPVSYEEYFFSVGHGILSV